MLPIKHLRRDMAGRHRSKASPKRSQTLGIYIPMNARLMRFNKNILRKKKLKKRAYIGYFIGYNFTNIFRI